MSKKLTICACSSRTFIHWDDITRVAVAAERSGWEVSLVPDLCALCQEKDPAVHEIAKTTVVACHTRAVKSLMAFVDEEQVSLCSIRENLVEQVLEQLGLDTTRDEAAEAAVKERLKAMPVKPGEDAWYPTLDKDVCGECGKCFDFCPFGVYEMVDDRVRVVHPHNCKNNCPACARTCPHSAIIFPKYDRSPINGGVEMQEKAVQLDSRTAYAEAFRAKLIQRRAGVSLLKKHEE